MSDHTPAYRCKELWLKFIYSEKATKFCKISTVDLYYVVMMHYWSGDFAKLCGLLRIYELYKTKTKPNQGSIKHQIIRHKPKNYILKYEHRTFVSYFNVTYECFPNYYVNRVNLRFLSHNGLSYKSSQFSTGAMRNILEGKFSFVKYYLPKFI